MLAEDALASGAAVAHVVAFYEHKRLALIERRMRQHHRGLGGSRATFEHMRGIEHGG